MESTEVSQVETVMKLAVIESEMIAAGVTPERTQAVILRAAHYIVQVLSQDVRFRQEGRTITDELGRIMDVLGVHYNGCECGCRGVE